MRRIKRQRRGFNIIKKGKPKDSLPSENKESQNHSGILDFTFHENNDTPIKLKKEIFGEFLLDKIIEVSFPEAAGSPNMFIQAKAENLFENFSNSETQVSFDLSFAQKHDIPLKKDSKKLSWRILPVEETESLELDILVLSFKNQFISLKDYSEIEKLIFRYESNSLFYVNSSRKLLGFDFEVKNLEKNREPVKCGIVKKDKTFIQIRSRTAKLHLVIEISKETMSNKSGELILHQYFIFN